MRNSPTTLGDCCVKLKKKGWNDRKIYGPANKLDGDETVGVTRMATLNFNPISSLPSLDMVASAPILPVLFNGYDLANLSTTALTLSSGASNRTVFSGENFTWTSTNGKLVITGGEVTDIEIRVSGTNVVNIEGLSLDAAELGTLLSNGSQNFWDFFLSANDTINGAGGNDVLRGFAGNDVLNGSSGNDTLFGDAGNDTLNGGSGNDTLDGGKGFDVATGGSGADVFVFKAGDDKMTITDFQPGVDDLSFVGLGAGFGVQQLIPYVSQQGADVVITDGVQEVRFQDTLLSELSAGDVFFV